MVLGILLYEKNINYRSDPKQDPNLFFVQNTYPQIQKTGSENQNMSKSESESKYESNYES